MKNSPMDNKKPTGGRIHFGSLENVEAARNRATAAAAVAAAAASPSIASPATPSTPQPQDTDTKTEDKHEFSDTSKRARDQHTEVMEMFDRKKRARSLAVPTDDKKVREKLRELDQPVCLFAEDNMDRRARLRDLMARDSTAEGGDVQMESEGEESGSGSDSEDEEFFTPGTDSLLKARRDIAHYSLPRAAKRVARQTEENKISMAVFKSMRSEEFEKL
ncbi:hypothetical protein BGZ83_003207, partial [Gryganskiella cystojenkinii]